jgi:hypothetical protein
VLAADLGRDHYRRQQRKARSLADALSLAWLLMSFDDVDGSWAEILDRVVGLVALAQFAQALTSRDYFDDQARAQDIRTEPRGIVDPRAFAGLAADGRDLRTLLAVAPITVKLRTAAGAPRQEAMRAGMAALLRAGVNEAQQAGHNAEFAAIVTQPGFEYHVRILTPPTCGRCAILAGRVYRWSDGFARHPGCDCQMVPTTVALDAEQITRDPKAYFDSLSKAEQAKFAGSEGGASAIRAGANPAQVVNVYAKRNRATTLTKPDGTATTYAPNSGLYEFDMGGKRLQYTNEGANVTRGQYGRAMGEQTGQTDAAQRRRNGLDPTPDQFELSTTKRLTPRAIFELADGDRDEAVRLLRRYGYIT